MISEHVSLAVAALQQVDEPARERIRANAIVKVSAFKKDGKVRVPGVAGPQGHPDVLREVLATTPRTPG
jgi:hypothetical protein